MTLRSPESARIERGALRFELGRAKIFTASQTGGPRGPRDCELWLVEGGEGLLSLAQRLIALGRHGIGRFSDYGLAEGALWLLREVEGTPLDRFVRARRHDLASWGLAERLRLGVQCARLLEECELSALFPGPMRPSELILDGSGRLHTRADTLVGSLLGLPELPAHNTPGNSLSPRWLPPEQANGAEWDALANRYVLGLVLYWLLAGAHAFAGLGLRHGLEEQRLRGAPPMPDEIARELPPGLQGLVLRMLEPNPDARPSSSSEVVERLEQFANSLPQGNEPLKRRQARTEPMLGPGAGQGVRDPQVPSRPASSDPQIHEVATLHSAGSDSEAAQDSPAQVSVRALREHRGLRGGAPQRRNPDEAQAAHERRSSPPRGERPEPEQAVDGSPRGSKARDVDSVRPRGNTRALRTLLALLPVVVGLGIAGWLLHEPAKLAPEGPVVKPQQPLDAFHTTSADCAGCHARQTAEWRRSVMAHSVKSPLFQGLEILIQEQVGKDLDCPGGAGVLRRVDTRTACRDRDSGLPITGAGGEHWCVNCHSPGDNLGTSVPPWDGRSLTSATRQPLKDLLPASAMEGISCAFCHQVAGAVRPGNQARGLYEGNPSWTSFVDGRRFSMRPEDSRGRFGIANSAYFLDPSIFLSLAGRSAGGGGFEPSAFPGAPTPGSAQVARATEELLGGAHLPIPEETKSYIQSSEFCGACHDVRLFGTDVLGARIGEHFKRLRNAYSEWVAYSNAERAKGKEPASCQDCHMSTFPGVCVPGEPKPGAAEAGGTTYTALLRGCPPGSHFEAREPGAFPGGHAAVNSGGSDRVTPHYFSGVDVPLGGDFEAHLVNEDHIDGFGIPLGARARRDLLLGKTFRFELRSPARSGSRLLIPVEIENVGGGHRVPAGFSQEREFWVHLRVTDASGRVVYEVGRVDRPDEDLHDKEFLRVNVRDDLRDGRGRPLGVFGADVADGRDVPRWFPDPRLGGTDFRGSGLINLQNGFLRCVVCIGRIDERGECQPGPGQSATRALRFTDGDYDLDTGECRSNLSGENALFETYFPIGSLDASRGVAKGPDAIIDRRSAPHGVPLRYTYDLPTSGAGPFHVEAELLFRAFPPFLIKAFAAYEEQMSRRGQRPSGPLVTEEALERLEIVQIAKVEVDLP